MRDRLLDLAEVGAGDVVVDVGCGDGLIGLGALARGAHVIFSDISQPCLDDCRAIAGDAAEYRLAAATELGEVEADVVTTRSVLIYVDDKARAFSEFFRVLRPGGRLAIFEPINRFGLEERQRTYGFGHIDGIEELMARVVAEVERSERAAGGLDAMVDFDERDLLAHAERAGFVEIRLTLIAEITAATPDQFGDWEVFLDTSPNPLAPTFREAMTTALTSEEVERVTSVLRPQFVSGELAPSRSARAFLAARKAPY